MLALVGEQAVRSEEPPTETAPAPRPLQKLENRVEEVESQNRLLQERLDALNRKYDAILNRPGGPDLAPEGPPAAGPYGNAPGGLESSPLLPSCFPSLHVAGPLDDNGNKGRRSRPGLGDFQLPSQQRHPDMEHPKRSVRLEYGDGLCFTSTDNWFQLVFHNLTQVDFRAFNPTGDPLHDSFIIPRQRWYFAGHVSEYVDFFTSINRGYTGNLVDPKSWSNTASATDTGWNWYLNHYVKLTFDWQHSWFGQPVLINGGNGAHTRHVDMMLTRMQLFF